MSSLDQRLSAFGGCAPLAGDCWVRVLYLDESGIGNLKSDPILVVAGVIVHADSQWANVANDLDRILSDATPFLSPRPSHLHATDIFHGSGEFPRDKWDQDRRWKLLDSVGALVEKYGLPVTWIAEDRKEYAKEHVDDSPEDHLRDAYTVCAVGCMMQAEIYMRQSPNSAEVASIVMEQNKALQRRIPEMIAFMRSPGDQAKHLVAGWESAMPLTKIIDSPASQPKTGSSILQLADYCAFAIKRRAQNKPGGQRLVKPIVAQMLKLQMRSPLWNPVHLPDFWPAKVTLKGGRFMKDV